ncbi:MAG: DNA topoisomerase IV subunit A, partial [Hyphomicrobiaceae bacterium]|nr:DNA topoisomerase IV subunit A [Hyphomicrobiaceae bacterium]
EPLRLMVDIEQNHDFVEAFVHQPERKLLVASTSGYGFVVPEAEVIAATRKGKQVLNVSEPDEARLVIPVEGDHVAVVGENRKMLIFRLAELNEMTRGKGVILFRAKDGGVSDVRVFAKANGLTWLDPAGRTFTLEWRDLKEWVGLRAQTGRVVPRGFPKSNRFGPAFD